MTCEPIRQKFKTLFAETMKDRFNYLSNENWFLAISKVLPWSDNEEAETTPEENVDSIQSDTDFWKGMIAAKRVTPDNVMFVIPRIDWTRGTVYNSYRDDIDLFDEDNPAKFYVLVDESRVYKCIDNNGGAQSNITPTHTDPTIKQLSDGYRWKFLYKITDTSLDFLTRVSSKAQAYMPVEFVENISSSSDQRSLQYTVQQSAVDGAIDFIEVQKTGEKFAYAIPARSDNNVAADAITGATAVFIAGAMIANTLNAHKGYVFRVESGRGEGQQRKVTKYVYQIPNGICYFTDPLDFAVDAVAGGSGSYYSILPYVKIEGDGTRNSNVYNTSRAEAEATARITDDRYLKSIEMVDPGKDYTYATVTIEPTDPTQPIDNNSSDTTNAAIARAIMSPEGGHGSNPVKELGAAAIMIFMKLESDEDGKFPIENDYRQFGLVVNPLLREPQQRLRLWESSATGTFVEGATGYISSNPNIYGVIERWIPSSLTGNSEIWLTSMTGGTFETGMTFSSGSVDRGIKEVDVRTVAGTEGFLCRKLTLISSAGATYSLGAGDFSINDYVISEGNTADFINSGRSFGEVVSWDLTLGSNKSGDLLLDKTTDKFIIGEDIGYLRRDFSIHTPTVAEITKINETELYTPTAYSQVYKVMLAYNGSDTFSSLTFEEDQLVEGISGGTAVGATSVWNGYVVEWERGSGGLTGLLSIVGHEGEPIVLGQSFNEYNSINSEWELIGTITGISQKNELVYRSGTLYYVENINLISRIRDQVEEIKIIIGS